MKKMQNLLHFCYIIHQIKSRASLFHWNFWVGQVNQPDVLDLHVTLWQRDQKRRSFPLFDDISLPECGQYMSQCATKVSF